MEHNIIRQREVGIDIVKLGAAIVVLSIHTYLFKDLSNIVYSLWHIAVSSAAVPFFFILSGYFLGRKLTKKKVEEVCVNIKNNRMHLIKCYCIWACWYSILFFIWDVLNGKNIIVSFVKHAISFCIGSPDTIMWYVATAAVGLLIFQKILMCRYSKKVFISATCMAIILYVFSFYWHNLPNEKSILVSLKNVYDYFMPSERVFFFRLNWLFIGIFCGWILNIDLEKEKLLEKRDITGVACCVVSLLLVFKYGFREDSVYVCVLTMVWYVTFALLLIKVGYLLSHWFHFDKNKTNYGNIATGIYFLHATVIQFYDIIVMKSGIRTDRTVEFVLCLFVTVFAVDCISNNKKIFKAIF